MMMMMMMMMIITDYTLHTVNQLSYLYCTWSSGM